MGRQPDYDLDGLRGAQAEQLVRQLRSDALSGRIEVKRDDESTNTRRAYFERACKSRAGEWYLSGLKTTKAETWVHVLPGNIAISIPVPLLRRACNAEKQEGRAWYAYERDGSNPTQGLVIPLTRLLNALLDQSE